MDEANCCDPSIRVSRQEHLLRGLTAPKSKWTQRELPEDLSLEQDTGPAGGKADFRRKEPEPTDKSTTAVCSPKGPI